MHRLLPSLCISSPLFSIDSLLPLHCLSSSHFPRFSTCIRHGHPFYTNHASIPSYSLSYRFQVTFLVTYVYGMLRLTSNSLPSPLHSFFLRYLFPLYYTSFYVIHPLLLFPLNHTSESPFIHLQSLLSFPSCVISVQSFSYLFNFYSFFPPLYFLYMY